MEGIMEFADKHEKISFAVIILAIIAFGYVISILISVSSYAEYITLGISIIAVILSLISLSLNLLSR